MLGSGAEHSYSPRPQHGRAARRAPCRRLNSGGAPAAHFSRLHPRRSCLLGLDARRLEPCRAYRPAEPPASWRLLHSARAAPVLDAVAAARVIPHSVVSHRSAALLHGLPILGAAPPYPELTVRPRRDANFRHVLVHRAGMRRCDVTVVGDIPVTSIARTLVDLGRSRAIGVAVAAVDAARQRGAVDIAALDDVLRSCWNWPGIARAQRAVRLSDSRSESPLESVSRLVLDQLRLPAPDLQTSVFDQLAVSSLASICTGTNSE